MNWRDYFIEYGLMVIIIMLFACMIVILNSCSYHKVKYKANEMNFHQDTVEVFETDTIMIPTRD